MDLSLGVIKVGCVCVFLRGVVKPSLCVSGGVAKLCMCVHTPQSVVKAGLVYMKCAPCVKELC